jgi:anti-anti-sigma factor
MRTRRFKLLSSLARQVRGLVAREAVELEVREFGDATVARFKGDILRGEDVPIVGRQLLSLAERKDHRELILDCSSVQLISSRAMGMLIALDRRIKEIDGRLRLYGLGPEIHKVFAITGLDKIFEIQKNLEEALDASHADSSRRLMWNRAAGWEAKGEHDKAIADYNDLIRMDPKKAAAYMARGRAWLAKGDSAKSIADHARAIRYEQDNALAGATGLALVEKQVCDRAVADFTKAIEIDPHDQQSWCNRGTARMWNRQYDAALVDYNQALQFDPRDVIALPQRFVAACNARLTNLGAPPNEASLKAKPAGQPLEALKAYGEEGAEERPSPPSAGAVARARVLRAVLGKEGAEEQPGAPLGPRRSGGLLKR